LTVAQGFATHPIVIKTLVVTSVSLGSAAVLSAATVDIPFFTTFESAAIGGSNVAITASDNTSVLFTETNSVTGGTAGATAISNANGTANSSFVDIGTAGSPDIVLRQSISGLTTSSTANTAAAFSHANADFVSAGGFRVSTTFTVDSFTVGTGGVMNISLNAFATQPNLTDGYRVVYTLSGTSAGVISVLQNGGSGALDTTPAVPAAVAPTGLITLTLQGIYSGTNLNLTATVSNGSGASATINVSDSTAVSNGNIFGIRSALAMGSTGSSPAINTNETVTFTSLSLQGIPEPSAAALVALAGVAVGFRRRRA